MPPRSSHDSTTTSTSASQHSGSTGNNTTTNNRVEAGEHQNQRVIAGLPLPSIMDQHHNSSNVVSNDDSKKDAEDWPSYCDDDESDDLVDHQNTQHQSSSSVTKMTHPHRPPMNVDVVASHDNGMDHEKHNGEDEDDFVDEEIVEEDEVIVDSEGEGLETEATGIANDSKGCPKVNQVPPPAAVAYKTPPSTPTSSSSKSARRRKDDGGLVLTPSPSMSHDEDVSPSRYPTDARKPSSEGGDGTAPPRVSLETTASAGSGTGTDSKGPSRTTSAAKGDGTTPHTAPRERSLLSPSLSSSGTRQQHRQRRRRKLQWKKSVRVNVIPNLSFYSEQERKNTWYQAEEYAVMEDECDLTSEFLDSKKPLWPGFCGRGLESWTMEGERRKERHVQLAVDIVWQAQLDQWRQASNTDECWEFIRSQYVQVSVPCLRLAAQMARQDEDEIQPYLSSVKALEKSRRKMLGIRSKSGGSRTSSGGGGGGMSLSSGSHHGSRRAKVGRTASDTTNLSPSKASPRRALSDGRSPSTPSRPILRPVLKDPEIIPQAPPPPIGATGTDAEKIPRIATNRSRKTVGPTSGASVTSRKSTGTGDHDDERTTTSVGSSSRNNSITSSSNGNKKKIEFKSGRDSKSKTKIPTSPVGSLCSSYAGTEDTSSTMRRMRSSHMSVGSDESTRRRMLRTAGIKTPL